MEENKLLFDNNDSDSSRSKFSAEPILENLENFINKGTDSLRELLIKKGISEDEINRAIKEDWLDLLVIDRLIMGASTPMNEEELLAITGMDKDVARRFWRALGFTEVPENEQIFNEQDIEAVGIMQSLVGTGFVDEDRAVQLARVIGSAVARVAEAQVTMAQSIEVPETALESAEILAFVLDELVPKLSWLIQYAWRRQLQSVLRRIRMHRYEGFESSQTELAVGFADMVGFTYLSQQIDENQLTEVVSRFETLAHDTVVAGGGRIVKMIGDEAMFVADTVQQAAHIALDLVDIYADDELLTDIRVGLSFGPVLAWDGDYFGTVVNRASRIVNIANPGSVLTTKEFFDTLQEDESVEFRVLRPRVLKDIGRVDLYSLQRKGVDPQISTGRLSVRLKKLTEVLRELDELRDHGQKLVSNARQSDSSNTEGSKLNSTIKGLNWIVKQIDNES
jgi:adenylate cyclase